MSEGTVSAVLANEASWCLLHGDSFRVLCDLPENSCDAGVIDPPAGIGFMGKDWDGDKGGMREWIDWLACIMDRTYRALKPGAHALVWALPRTSHWTGMALEFAGFEIRGQLQHWFGSGFPKSLDVAKAIDAHLGVERKVVGSRVLTGTAALSPKDKGGTFSAGVASNGHTKEVAITEATTPEAQQWDGWGTALKPGHEVWWLVRKPLERGLTVAENVLKWGTGALNIDEGRIQSNARPLRIAGNGTREKIPGWGGFGQGTESAGETTDGRWPSDLVLTHDHRCERLGTVEVPANPTWDTPNRATAPSAFTGSEVSKVRHANGRDGEASADRRYNGEGSTSFAPLPGPRRETEAVAQWECVEGCPVLELDRQSGARPVSGAAVNGTPSSAPTPQRVALGGGLNGNGAMHNDSGTASRYFQQFEWTPELDDISLFVYAAKPSRAERDAGLEHFKARSAAEATDSEDGQARLASPRTGAGRTGGARNIHATVKGQEFLRYCCKLITPPRGVIVTPFAGSGSEGMAAVSDGFRFIGIEKNDTDEEPYVSIARARITWIEGRTFVPRESLRAAEPPKQRSLF